MKIIGLSKVLGCFLTPIFIFILLTATSRAEDDFKGNLVTTGTALIPNEGLERVVQKVVAAALNGDFIKSHLRFDLPVHKLRVPFSPNKYVQLFTDLGLNEALNVTINPIRVFMTLPEKSFHLDVKRIDENNFDLHVHWEITNFGAECESLNIHVPKGVFDQPVGFDIASTPVKIDLNPEKDAITLDAELSLDLRESGTRFVVKSVSTNLLTDTSPVPFLLINLGPLSVNKARLKLRITSPDDKITTIPIPEEAIREQIQSVEGSLELDLRKTLHEKLQEMVKAFAEEQSKSDPLKFSMSTNEILEGVSEVDQPDVHTLLHDIDFTILLKEIGTVNWPSNYYSAQLTSRVCIAEGGWKPRFRGAPFARSPEPITQNDFHQSSELIYGMRHGKQNSKFCLDEGTPPIPLTKRDYLHMPVGNQIGAYLYESWLQNVLHSDIFERRFRNYWATQHINDGIGLAEKGIRIHLNPGANAIVAVINLELDLDQMSKIETDKKEAFTKEIGGKIESIFGGGAKTVVPLELTFHLEGITQDKDGNNILNLHTEYPFVGDSDMKNFYQYPSSMDGSGGMKRMTELVKGGVVSAIKLMIQGGVDKAGKAVKPAIDEHISFPIGKTYGSDKFKFAPRKLMVTSSHALLFTAEMIEKTPEELALESKKSGDAKKQKREGKKSP